MELSGAAYPIGSVVPCVLLGVLELIDQGELDYKILVMAADHRTLPPFRLPSLSSAYLPTRPRMSWLAGSAIVAVVEHRCGECAQRWSRVVRSKTSPT